MTGPFVDDAGAADTAAFALDAGPLQVAVAVVLPAAGGGTLTVVAPAPDAVIPAPRPAFTVAVDTAVAGAQVEVWADTDPGFSAPIVMVGPAPAGLAAAQVTVYPGTDLVDGSVYYWQARLTTAYGPGPWFGLYLLATSFGDGYAYTAGAVDVVAQVPAPAHLWWLDPASGADSGATAYAVGAGFGPGPQVFLDGQACLTAAYTHPATAEAFGPGRQLVPGGAVDAYHEVVAFVLPALDADHVGGIVTVRSGG